MFNLVYNRFVNEEKQVYKNSPMLVLAAMAQITALVLGALSAANAVSFASDNTTAACFGTFAGITSFDLAPTLLSMAKTQRREH